MLNWMLANTSAAAGARIMVSRPTMSMTRGLGTRPRPRTLWPSMSLIATEDMAAEPEAAVEDSEPMIMMQNSATRPAGRYSAATCGSRLLGSSPIGSMPAKRARTPTMPMPMIGAPRQTDAVMKVGLIRSSRTANSRWAMVWLPIAYARNAAMYGAPWLRNASEEKNDCCCGVRLSAPETNRSVPPRKKNMAGTMMTTAPRMASSCAKSVSTEARKPDHSVYNSTPAAITMMPWPKLNGLSMAMSAPPAMKLDVSEMTEPRMLDPASISWDERPWRANITSASVCASGATLRMRLPNG